MDRKVMCIIICLMIGMGAALNIVGQALASEGTYPPSKPRKDEMERMAKASLWCINLSYLMGAIALLLILCCLCCRDVSFGKSGKDDYD